jgi:hypothetical protein
MAQLYMQHADKKCFRPSKELALPVQNFVMLIALYGDLLCVYRMSLKSENKCEKYGKKIIYVTKYSKPIFVKITDTQ